MPDLVRNLFLLDRWSRKNEQTAALQCGEIADADPFAKLQADPLDRFSVQRLFAACKELRDRRAEDVGLFLADRRPQPNVDAAACDRQSFDIRTLALFLAVAVLDARIQEHVGASPRTLHRRIAVEKRVCGAVCEPREQVAGGLVFALPAAARMRTGEVNVSVGDRYTFPVKLAEVLILLLARGDTLGARDFWRRFGQRDGTSGRPQAFFRKNHDLGKAFLVDDGDAFTGRIAASARSSLFCEARHAAQSARLVTTFGGRSLILVQSRDGCADRNFGRCLRARRPAEKHGRNDESRHDGGNAPEKHVALPIMAMVRVTKGARSSNALADVVPCEGRHALHLCIVEQNRLHWNDGVGT